MVNLILLRYAIWIIAIAAIIAWIVFARRIRYIGYALAVILYLINLIAFTTVRLVGPGAVDAMILNTWSLAIHLQGTLTLLLVGIFLAVWEKQEHERR